jgi:hypothetical protein
MPRSCKNDRLSPLSAKTGCWGRVHPYTCPGSHRQVGMRAGACPFTLTRRTPPPLLDRPPLPRRPACTWGHPAHGTTSPRGWRPGERAFPALAAPQGPGRARQGQAEPGQPPPSQGTPPRGRVPVGASRPVEAPGCPCEPSRWPGGRIGPPGAGRPLRGAARGLPGGQCPGGQVPLGAWTLVRGRLTSGCRRGGR